MFCVSYHFNAVPGHIKTDFNYFTVPFNSLDTLSSHTFLTEAVVNGGVIGNNI